MNALVKYEPTKPAAQREYEEKLRDALIEQGLPQEIAEAIVGYRPEDVPFIYRTEPHKVTNGNTYREEYSHLWIGTTDAIWNMEGDWSDQIKEVIVQWWGHSPLDDSEPIKVERLEAHQIADGSFVELSYRNVSEMGAFDGVLVSISYYRLGKKFNPWGGKARDSYRIHGFRREQTEDGEMWFVNLNSTNVEGTTILNGYSQITQFHLGEVEAMKADFVAAFRYTPLPEPDHQLILTSGEPEAVFNQLVSESEQNGIVRSLLPEVMRLMENLAPIVVQTLADGKWYWETIQMARDGILNHPEKIAIFGKRLSDLSREQRWTLVNFVVKSIHEGNFVKWMQNLTAADQQQFVKDTATRNGYHLLNWFMRTAPANVDLSDWIGKAAKAVQQKMTGGDVEDAMEYQRVFDGMCTSFVERFIEYVVQLYFGNTLE